jgi:hypothetical protein
MSKVVKVIKLSEPAESITSIVLSGKYRNERIELIAGIDFDLSECGEYAIIYKSAHDKLKKERGHDQN